MEEAMQGVNGVSEVRDGYLGLLSYIVSNTVAGELMAIDNYSQLAARLEDTEEKLRFVGFASDESKHVRLLAKLGQRLGFKVEQRIVEPQWLAVRAHFKAAAERDELCRCIFIQDLMVESMAITLYRTLAGQLEAKVDDATATVARTILRDEEEHLGFAVSRLKSYLREDPSRTHDDLVWAHHRVMPELYSMADTSCHSLCGVLGLDCGALNVADLKTDMDTIRVSVVEHYASVLERIGFDVQVTNPLIGSLASYHEVRASDSLMRGEASSEPGRCC
jgi:fatty aldehyde decarbonylase